MKMLPLIIIQARIASTRLPGKINKWLGPKGSMLSYVVDRAEKTGLPYTVARADQFPGIPEEDVLTRFNAVLKQYPDADPIIRITADCPMLDAGMIGRMLAQYEPPFLGTGPEWDGLDVEIINRSLLFLEGANVYEREHVTSMIRDLTGATIIPPPPDGPLRWSVDDQSGLEFVQRVFKACTHCEQGVTKWGPGTRPWMWDLHYDPLLGPIECDAAEILLTRMGGQVYETRR